MDSYKSSSETGLMDQLVKCKNCELVYVNPRIDNSFTYAGYSEAIDIRHHEQDVYRIKSFKRAINKILVMLESNNVRLQFGEILDVGCAGGAFPKAAQDLGYKVVGLEPSRYLADHGVKKYKLEIYTETLEKFAERKRKFSVISLWDVLEHLPDPKLSLGVIDSILKDDGILVLNLPMIDTLPARLLGKIWPFYLNVHITYYEKKTITRLLQDTGFEIIGISRYYQSLSLGYVLFRTGLRVNETILKSLNFSVRYYMGQRTIIAKKRTHD